MVPPSTPTTDITLKLQSPDFLLRPSDLKAVTQVNEEKIMEDVLLLGHVQEERPRVDLKDLIPSLIEFASNDLLHQGRPSYIANLETDWHRWSNLASPKAALVKRTAKEGRSSC